jgi:hypothetical protein
MKDYFAAPAHMGQQLDFSIPRRPFKISIRKAGKQEFIFLLSLLASHFPTCGLAAI